MPGDPRTELRRQADFLGLSDFFTLERVLGQGGMGVVFLAVQKSLNRQVALKVLVVGPESTADVRDRFQREARLASLVRHPAVVEVFLHGETPACLYIAYRLVEGPTLYRARADQGPMPLGQVVELFGVLLEGVAAIHKQGIVHRDLKPENILMEAGIPRITDLGISRALHEAAITQARVLQGTPLYMAPEVICGEALTIRVDLYATGMMILEAMAGAHPFRDLGSSTLRAHLTQDPLAGPFPIEIDASWMAFLRRSLEKDPAERFSTADEMRQEMLQLPAGASRNPARSRGGERTVALGAPRISSARELTVVQSRATSAPSGHLRKRTLIVISVTPVVLAMMVMAYRWGVVGSGAGEAGPGRGPGSVASPARSPGEALPATAPDPVLERLRAGLESAAPMASFPDAPGDPAVGALSQDVLAGLARELQPGTISDDCDIGLFVTTVGGGGSGELALRGAPEGAGVSLNGVDAKKVEGAAEAGWTRFTLPAEQVRPGINLLRITPRGAVSGLGATRLRLTRGSTPAKADPGCKIPALDHDQLAGLLGIVGVGSWASAKERISKLALDDPGKRQAAVLSSYARIGYGVALARVTDSPVPYIPMMSETGFDFAPKPSGNFVRALVSLQRLVEDCPEDWLAWVFLGRGLYASGFQEAGWTALTHAASLDSLGPVTTTMLFITIELYLAERNVDRSHLRLTREALERATRQSGSAPKYFQDVWRQAFKRMR